MSFTSSATKPTNEEPQSITGTPIPKNGENLILF